MMEYTPNVLSLLPPILAIGLALLTRQVFLALFLGIASGFLILAGGHPLQGAIQTMGGFVAVFESNYNTEIIIFTLLIGALIALIQRAGGVAGFVNRVLAWLQRKAASADGKGQRKRVELLAVLTGVLIFVESNISTLTVGTLYRPLTDELKIPREKLAYIADSTCAPICILIPLNAWGAYILGLLGEQNIESPISTLVGAVALNIYPMLAVALVILVIITGRDVGEMKRAERRAAEEGKLIRDGAVPMISGDITMMESKDGVRPKARNMILPLAALVILMPVFMLYTGWGPAGENGLFELADRALIFLISAFIAFSTGTSWGTFAIMIAIAVPLAQGLDTNVTLAVAAALGGGVFGDHCSPTSDTSIITSMATGSDHIDHVRTQLPYALIGGAITTVAYLILGNIGA